MVNKYNIILSYSSKDDLPDENGIGWITLFSNYLMVSLNRVTDKRFNFFAHTDNEQVNLPNSSHTILLIILSPAYLKSNLLSEIVNHFGLNEKNELKARLFKIVKEPVNELDLPEVLKSSISYNFYEHVQVVRNKTFQKNEWNAWQWIKMLDIINKIKGVSEEETALNSGFFIKPALPAKKVYLAFTGNDLVIYRDIIFRELIRQNIEVRPLELFHGEVNQIEQQIKQEMDMCDLSIHLFGEEYGELLMGGERSLFDIQNKVAVELSSKPFKDKTFGLYKQFSRLVWISPELNNITEKQKLFIENIKRDSKALKEDEILQVPFDELKDIIQNKLVYNNHYFSEPFQKSRYIETGKGSIYLIYEKNDQQISKIIADYLEQQGYYVIHSNFEGDALSTRNRHQESLRICDASLIICDKVNLEWVNSKLQDLMKAPGFGRIKPFKAKALYVNSDHNLNFNNKLINLNDSIILASSDNFIPESFYLFLNKLSA